MRASLVREAAWSAGIVLSCAAVLAGQQAPTFGAAVDSVRVDVIVTDERGRFVDDLTAADFVVREDGVVQDVVGFQLVDLRPDALPRGATLDGGAEARRAAAAVTAPSTLQPDRAALGALVFLIDFPGLDWKNKERFVQTWSDLLSETDALGIPRAVYLIDQVGRLEELAPLTLDAERIREAVETVRSTPLGRRGIHEQLLVGSAGELRASNAEELARSRRTLELLTQFSAALRARQGRTALIWVTSELQSMEAGPFAALSVARVSERVAPGTVSLPLDFDPFAHVTADTRVVRLQQELHRAANSANVSIYTVDPTPQAEWRSIGSDVRATADTTDLLGGLEVQASLDGLRDSLRQAAERTGGRSFIGWSELERVLPEIERDAGRFYLLTYRNPAPLGDGGYHEIRVEVLRPGAQARAREGYVDLPDAERIDRSMSAALALPGTVSGFPVHARAVRRWAQDGAPIVQLIAAAGEKGRQPDGAGRTATPSLEAGATPTLPVEVRAVAVTGDDEVAAEVRHSMQPNNGEAGQPVSVGGAYGPVLYVHDWKLEPDAYDIRIAMREEASGRMGATRLAVDVPAPSGGWQASDLLLLAYDDRRVRPLASDVLREGESLAIQLEVAGGARPVLSGALFAADETTLIAPLPPVTLARDAAGIHRGVLQATGFEPGAYIVQASVTDAEAGEHRTFRRRIEVLPGAPRR